MSRRVLIIALVLVPLAVIGVVVGLGVPDDEPERASGRSDATTTTAASEATPGAQETTTAPGASDPAGPSDAAPPEQGDVEPGPEAPETTVPAEPEIPSPPGVAGVEGDRPVVTYPQPTVPDGGCSERSGTVVITLGAGPDPACVSVAGDQTVEFVNATGGEISIVAEAVNEVLPDGERVAVVAGGAFPEGRSTFWSPGNPDLSGIVEVRA